MVMVGSSSTSSSSRGSSRTSSHSFNGSSQRGQSRVRLQPTAVFATSAATLWRVATEPRGGALSVELTTTAPATIPVRTSRPHQLHLRGRGNDDEVVDMAFRTSSRSRGLRDGFSPSTTSRQRSPPATLLKVFFHSSVTRPEF